ncbi:hypothetical protein, partial [Aeromonas caviae]|uniref:hypothetical protein n=1 Tax=Aeromonas caviae TaxID=648 RepID=UPI001CC63C7B
MHTLRGGQNWTLKTPETWSFLRADQHDLNDVVEASGDMLARLAIFADHIPDEWITAAAALSE